MSADEPKSASKPAAISYGKVLVPAEVKNTLRGIVIDNNTDFAFEGGMLFCFDYNGNKVASIALPSSKAHEIAFDTGLSPDETLSVRVNFVNLTLEYTNASGAAKSVSFVSSAVNGLSIDTLKIFIYESQSDPVISLAALSRDW